MLISQFLKWISKTQIYQFLHLFCRGIKHECNELVTPWIKLTTHHVDILA
jgi:hypothetical protein